MFSILLEKLYVLLQENHRKISNSKLIDKLCEFGKESNIQYPYNIGGPERMYIGEKVTILSNARLQVFPKLTGDKGRIFIGDRCFIGYNFTILAGDDVYIGSDVTIASSVAIFSENHGFDPSLPESYGKQPLLLSPVTIGDGCWIGEKAIILPGVKIGKKCVIGASAVVNRDVPDYSIAVGNPVRVIKTYNFDKNNWDKTL